MNSVKELEEKLREAASIGNEDLLNDLTQSGVDVNSRNPVNGWTALHWAAKRGHSTIVTFLLSRGARKDAMSEKGEKPIDVASSKEVILALGGDPTDTSQKESTSSLPFVPNYLANPVFPYGSSGDGISSKNSPMDREHGLMMQQPSMQRSGHKEQEDELVLKVRVANAAEKDFIEIEIPFQKLTFENLIYIMCQELQVHTSLVTKIRKLPDTIVRKDKDVGRLRNFQELELVLSNKYISESSRNYKPTVSPRNENIVY